jgi:transposase
MGRTWGWLDCLRRVVIVADRGLNSKLNLKSIEVKGYDYIVATRLKKMNQRVLQEVFNPQGYTSLSSKPFDTEPPENADVLQYKILDHINRVKDDEGKVFELAEKHVITYSPKRARKDKADRERLIEKAKRLLEEP